MIFEHSIAQHAVPQGRRTTTTAEQAAVEFQSTTTRSTAVHRIDLTTLYALAWLVLVIGEAVR